MKWNVLFMAALVSMLLTGCGGTSPGGTGGADENKPLDQVAADAAAMGKAELQKMVEKYETAIAGKAAEIDALKAKIKEIPLAEMMGEKAKALKDDLDNVTRSLNALKERLDVYVKELQKEMQP